MQKNLALIAKYFKKICEPTNNNLRTSSNSKNKNVDTTLWFKNDNQLGQFRNPRTVNVVTARENVRSKGVSLQAEQYDCNTCLVETDDGNVTPDSPVMCEDEIQNEQNDVESDDKRVTLASLIANLKLDTKQAEFEKYKTFNDRIVYYDKLKHALTELQCMYLHKVKECDCLAQKLSKQTESVSKNDTVCNEKAANVFRKEREQYFKIQDLKAQLQDKNIATSELKKLIEKGKGKSVDTKFDRPPVVQKPNAQRIPKPSILGKPTPFSNSLDRIYFQKTRPVSKANVSEGLSKPVTTQTLPQTAKKA
nr:hypothetical protein [Tanacetum cinerariifolium]